MKEDAVEYNTDGLIDYRWHITINEGSIPLYNNLFTDN